MRVNTGHATLPQGRKELVMFSCFSFTRWAEDRVVSYKLEKKWYKAAQESLEITDVLPGSAEVTKSPYCRAGASIMRQKGVNPYINSRPLLIQLR